MSLVNLAHVCSHLQNASLARLGLTSIPYTKSHLSLALLLHKQGFLSQVKLGGPSPPSSCFGTGPVDNHYVSNHPQRPSGRDPRSPEAALALMVREGRSGQWLRTNGFGEEAVEFAEEHGIRSAQELEEQGYADGIAQLVTDVRHHVDALLDARSSEAEPEWTRMTPEQQRASVEDEATAHLPPAHRAIFEQYRDTDASELQTMAFPHATLRSFAGPNAYHTETDIALNGISISAMGLQIHNQPLTLPKQLYQDPTHLEDEGVVTQQNRASRRLWLGLKYHDSKPVITKARLVSKPTKRIWLSARELGKVVRGTNAGEVRPLSHIGEIMAISTDKGIMEARECVERRIGGQALCRVW